jgi:hypothetical protein
MNKHAESGGRITKLTFPPLSTFLREMTAEFLREMTAVMTATRFRLKYCTLPDGDLEESVSANRCPAKE